MQTQIHIPPKNLPGELSIPEGAISIILFAHGSGSSRLSPRNRAVAAALNEAGFATLLFDLLTPEEERDRTNVFAIDLLATRLIEAVRYLDEHQGFQDHAVGLFGASTGGGAAIVAASRMGQRISAVVSRGGRPDLAGGALDLIAAPTLLIVGGDDHPVLEMNEKAALRLKTGLIEIVPGATHLFPEPGAMERVVELAVAFFDEHLRPA